MNKHKLSHAVRQAMFEKTNYSSIDSLDTSKVGAEVLRRLTGKKYKVIPGKLRINKWYPCDHTVIINETDKEFIDLCADEYAEVMREDFTYIWLPFKDMPKWLEFAVDECRYDIEQQIGDEPNEALVKRALEIYQEISGNVA